MEIAVDNEFEKTSEEVICTQSGSDWYEARKIYPVYKKTSENGSKNARRYVRGSDGIFDDIAMTVSKFKTHERKRRK